MCNGWQNVVGTHARLLYATTRFIPVSGTLVTLFLFYFLKKNPVSGVPVPTAQSVTSALQRTFGCHVDPESSRPTCHVSGSGYERHRERVWNLGLVYFQKILQNKNSSTFVCI